MIDPHSTFFDRFSHPEGFGDDAPEDREDIESDKAEMEFESEREEQCD